MTVLVGRTEDVRGTAGDRLGRVVVADRHAVLVVLRMVPVAVLAAGVFVPPL
jgi:hypothetical protein